MKSEIEFDFGNKKINLSDLEKELDFLRNLPIRVKSSKGVDLVAYFNSPHSSGVINVYPKKGTIISYDIPKNIRSYSFSARKDSLIIQRIEKPVRNMVYSFYYEPKKED